MCHHEQGQASARSCIAMRRVQSVSVYWCITVSLYHCIVYHCITASCITASCIAVSCILVSFTWLVLVSKEFSWLPYWIKYRAFWFPMPIVMHNDHLGEPPCTGTGVIMCCVSRWWARSNDLPSCASHSQSDSHPVLTVPSHVAILMNIPRLTRTNTFLLISRSFRRLFLRLFPFALPFTLTLHLSLQQ